MLSETPTRTTRDLLGRGWRFPIQPDRLGRLLPGRGDGRAPHAPAAAAVRTEAFRSIRTSVLFCNAEHPPRLLLVTSSQPQEGKTSTTVNLALSLSQLAQAHVRCLESDRRAS